MATYNGEKFIREQLESILMQTIPVDEIIISDDGSSDATCTIVQSFHDPRIKLITDNPNPGYCNNFEHALKHTSGDYVFLADQDDIWMPDKVKKTIGVFQEHPEIELVITNGIQIDAAGKPLDSVFHPAFTGWETGKVSQVKYFAYSVYNCLALGMCMCFSRSLFDSIFPFPETKTGRLSLMGHDMWIAFCGMKNDSIFYLSDILVQYRIHGANTSQPQVLSFRTKFQKYLKTSYILPLDRYSLMKSILAQLNPEDPAHAGAIRAAQTILTSYSKQLQAINKNPIYGSYELLRLYRTNTLYQSNGIKFLALQLLFIFFGRRNIIE